MPVLKASVVPGYLTNARGRTRVVVHLTGPEEELDAQGCCSCSLHVNENRQRRRELEQGGGAQQAAGDGRSAAGRGPMGGGRRGGCPWQRKERTDRAQTGWLRQRVRPCFRERDRTHRFDSSEGLHIQGSSGHLSHDGDRGVAMLERWRDVCA